MGTVQRCRGLGCGWRPHPGSGELGCGWRPHPDGGRRLPLPPAGRHAALWEGASGIPPLSLDVQPRPWGRPHTAESAGSPRVRDPAGPRRDPPSGRDAPRPRVTLTCGAAAASQCAPGSALGKLRPGPLPQPRPGGRGQGPRPVNQERPPGARGQSAPRHAAPPRGTRRKHSRGIPALRNTSPAPRGVGPSRPS